MIIKKMGKEKPSKEIKLFCQFLGISTSSFFKICDKLRNKKIWYKNSRGEWRINNFLIPNWNWK